MRSLFVVFLVVGLLLPLAARAQPCHTPRAAVSSWLDSLQGDQIDSLAATRCFDWQGAQTPPDARLDLSQELKRVFDARGLYISLEQLPDTLEADGDNRVLLHPQLPQIWVQRSSAGWLISAESIRAIPTLYEHTFNVDLQRWVDQLPSWLREVALFGVAWWQLLGVLLIALVGVLLRALVSRLLTWQGTALLERYGDSADRKFVKRAANPVGTLLMAAWFWYALPSLGFGIRVSQVLVIGVRVLAACAGVMLLYRLVDVGSDVFSRRAERTATKLDDQLVPLVRRGLKVFVAAIGVLFVLQNLNVDIGSLLAGASLGGLAFTLAAKDTVANLFGSISIFADQPFQVGDYVSISGNEGTVIEVGMRSTRIRTSYRSVITIPNSIVANAAIDNYGKREFRRCRVTLGLTYDTHPRKMQAFVEGLRAILHANPKVVKETFQVHFNAFGDSALEVFVNFFIDTRQWDEELATRHDVFLETMRLAEALDVSFAFPTQTVHVETLAATTEPMRVDVPDDEALRQVVEDFGPNGKRAQPESPTLTDGGFAAKG